VYNNIPGQIPGMTLGTEENPFGKTIPTIGISREDGLALAEIVKGGNTLNGRLYVLTVIRNVTT
jgi:hypothetical protein